MQPEFWLDRWRAAQIGFHQSKVDRFLATYWPRLNVAPQSRVFVPLCGKSLDLLWLREQGHEVIGVELSPVALEAFCMEHGIPARRRTTGDFEVYEASGFTLYRGDFFKLTPALLNNVAAVYDRGSLISWSPDLRASYVEHMTALTAPDTRTLLIAVEYPAHQMSGPPFPVTAEAIQALYAPQHTIRPLARHDILELEPRFKARGLKELREVCYELTRL